MSIEHLAKFYYYYYYYLMISGDMDMAIKPIQKEAFNYYKKNTMSVELVKDDHLQKLNFRVKDKVKQKYLIVDI